MRETESSIAAELWAAGLIGGVLVAAQDAGEEDPAEALRVFHAGLVSYLASRQTPDALAALRAFSLVGDPIVRDLFRQTAAELSGLGIAEPRWFTGSEPLEPLDAFHVGDPFGESEVIMVGFRRPEGDHALMALVDLVTDQGLVQLELLDVPAGGVRELMEAYRGTEGLTDPAPLSLAQARARLDQALETYINFAPLPDEETEEDGADPAITWPVLIPRLEALPTDAEEEPQEPDEAQLAAVVDSFLASSHARSLPDRELARAWAFSAVDWAVEYGWEPTWFGPIGLSELLLEQADRHLEVAESEMPALEATIGAWAHFTADIRELPADTHQLWDEALPAIWADFRDAYTDPDAVEHRAICDGEVALRDYEAGRAEAAAILRAVLADLDDPEADPLAGR